MGDANRAEANRADVPTKPGSREVTARAGRFVHKASATVGSASFRTPYEDHLLDCRRDNGAGVEPRMGAILAWRSQLIRIKTERVAHNPEFLQ